MLPVSTTLNTTRAAIYTVPANTRATIRTINLVNRDASMRKVNLFLVVSGVPCQIGPADLELKPNYQGIEDAEIQLAAGDKVEGYADGDLAVSIYIGGEEKKA